MARGFAWQQSRVTVHCSFVSTAFAVAVVAVAVGAAPSLQLRRCYRHKLGHGSSDYGVGCWILLTRSLVVVVVVVGGGGGAVAVVVAVVCFAHYRSCINWNERT